MALKRNFSKFHIQYSIFCKIQNTLIAMVRITLIGHFQKCQNQKANLSDQKPQKNQQHLIPRNHRRRNLWCLKMKLWCLHLPPSSTKMRAGNQGSLKPPLFYWQVRIWIGDGVVINFFFKGPMNFYLNGQGFLNYCFRGRTC